MKHIFSRPAVRLISIMVLTALLICVFSSCYYYGYEQEWNEIGQLTDPNEIAKKSAELHNKILLDYFIDSFKASADLLKESAKNELENMINEIKQEFADKFSADQIKGDINKYTENFLSWLDGKISELTGKFKAKDENSATDDISGDKRVELLLNALCEEYDGEYWTSDGKAANVLTSNVYYYNGGIQCKAFANWAADIVFDLGGNSIGATYTPSYTKDEKELYDYTAVDFGGRIDISDTAKTSRIDKTLSLTSTNAAEASAVSAALEDLFLHAPNGAFIQVMGRDNETPHSMIYLKTKSDEANKTKSAGEKVISVLDCNFGNDYRVQVHSFTYAEFIRSFKTVSVYGFTDDPDYKLNKDYKESLPFGVTAPVKCDTYSDMGRIKKNGYIDAGDACIVTMVCGDTAKVTYPNTVAPKVVTIGGDEYHVTTIISAWVKLKDMTADPINEKG